MTTKSKDWPLQGVIADDPLLKWLGWKWIAKMKAYGDFLCYEDYAWAYRERTAIGFLAAAAWSIRGGVALEEYGAQKRPSTSGRIDLYTGFKIAGESKPQDYLWEAKHAFLKLNSSEPVQDDRIRQTLKSAHCSAEQVIPHGPEVALAVGFFTLMAGKVKRRGRVKEEQVGWLERARQLILKLEKTQRKSVLIAYLAAPTTPKNFIEHRHLGILLIAERSKNPNRRRRS